MVNFCLKSLPKGYAACDSELSPAVSKICAEHIGQPIDACSDGKVAQYYKIRSSEMAKNSTIINGSKNKINSDYLVIMFEILSFNMLTFESN